MEQEVAWRLAQALEAAVRKISLTKNKAKWKSLEAAVTRIKGEKSRPAKRPRSLRKGPLTSMLARVSPSNLNYTWLA
eukprot:368943-Pelagomonas_calceolata.AAC.1